PAGVILEFVKSLDRLLADQPEPVTLVTLGPVTSLALALRRDAALVLDKVKRHVAMMGNVAAPGNTTPYAEFNAWCDPEAPELVHPGLLAFEEQRLMVDLDEAEHRGHTRVDPDGVRVKVAMRVDLGPVRRLLSERVFRWAASAATAPIASVEVQV